MKNKEIEILKHMIEFYKKFCDVEEELNPIVTGKEIKAIETILSYIEQLEKIIYKARKMIFDNYGVLDKYGIEMLDDILKGDSDE